jgi:hypothetical protein
VNYLDHDVAAHAFGPQDRAAFRALEFVDRSIRQIGRVLRRVPEHQYDLYILSDHGQAQSKPFAELTAGKPLERLLFDELLDPPTSSDIRLRRTSQPGSPMASWPTTSGGRGWASAS